MKVVITLVNQFDVTTYNIYKLEETTPIIEDVNKLKQQKKTFYVSLYTYDGKCKDYVFFERGVMK
jgi:hypothetical protein